MNIVTTILLLTLVTTLECRRRRVRGEDSIVQRQGQCGQHRQCWSRQFSVRRRPTRLKLMCSPGLRPIRCRMVSVGRWQDRRTARQNMRQRVRIKRKPQVKLGTQTSWSAWRQKPAEQETVKVERVKVEKDEWKPLSNVASVASGQGSVKDALKQIKNSIKKQKLKLKVEQGSWKPIENTNKHAKEVRSEEEKSLRGQMVRLGENGKILTV